MNRVEIVFDCLPLRSISRLDIPLDASPGYIRKCESIQRAMETHGTFNTYFLHNASCTYFVTNHPDMGHIKFSFEGTVATDPDDRNTVSAALEVKLAAETCPWLTQPIVEWFAASVPESVKYEFDRYIHAGDLSKTAARIEALQKTQDSEGGFLGMYL